MKKVSLGVFALLGACAGSEPAASVEIENFKSGLVCPHHPENGEGWICFETEEVYITGQSQCVFNGKAIPCDWYGFEFEYKAISKDNSLKCKSRINEAGHFGNPEGVISEGIEEFEYDLALPGMEGRFFNPQYSAFPNTVGSEKNIVSETKCYAGEREVFRVKRQLIYPKIQ